MTQQERAVAFASARINKGENFEMIFTGPHWWAGVVQTVVLAAELLFLLLFLRRRPKAGKIMILLVGLYFLAYKLWEYISNRKWPIDFSALTYFLFGIAAILPFRPLKTSASFSGFLAGGIFIVSFMFFPEFHARSNPILYYRAMGFANHNLLFTASVALFFQYRFRFSHIAWIVGWIIFVVVYSETMIYGFHVEDSAEIVTKIIDASIMEELFPGLALTWWGKVLYYTTGIGLLGFFIWIAYRLNAVFQRRT